MKYLMRDDGHIRRVRANLLGSGFIAIFIGVCWTATFVIFDRPILAALHAVLIVLGVTIFCLAYLGRVTVAAIIAIHAMPVVIFVSCLFDNLPDVHRSTHIHFLSVALGAYFVFRRSGIYLRYILPAACLIAFAVFSNASIGFNDPMMLLPEPVAAVAAWSNVVSALGLLVFIVIIMNADLSVRRMMEIEMRKAIANGEFELHYQPQLGEQGRVFGAEALIRWRHAKMGNIPPVEFIPLAEETGLIVPIGNWVLRAACAQLALWEAQPQTRHLTMAVNVSVSQFHQPDFVQSVSEIVRLSGITPAKLKLELTESMFVDNVDGTVAKMNALKALGIVWSLDDFGTGYSSLSVLNRFPLGQIKIDKSFVRDMLVNNSNMVVTEAIITLANKLNLQVIAEGVETSDQLERLKAAGCHAYQGYFFSPPLPIDAFGKFLTENAAAVDHPLSHNAARGNAFSTPAAPA